MTQGNGSVEALHRIGLAEAENRSLREEIRAMRQESREQSAKLDHILTLKKAHGECLDWLVKERRMRRRKKAA